VRSLVRLKLLTDELRMRAATGRQIGIDDPLAEAVKVSGDGGRILIVDDRASSHNRISRRWAAITCRGRGASAGGVVPAAGRRVRCRHRELEPDGFDGLRLCSQIRTLERIRNLPILVISEPEDNDSGCCAGLDLGVNDYIVRPVDRNELIARVATQVRRKRYGEKLRDNVQLSVTMALTDPLTGLLQPALYGKPSGDAGSSRRPTGGGNCRCLSSISTISRRSTTPTATMRATRCCANSQVACARRFAA
jgi:two-component system, cell cycle response regulator